MTRSIASAVARFKQDPRAHLDHRLVLRACAAAQHRWRQRLLDPVTTLYLLILQVLHGNCACRRLRHLSGLRFSTSAYCKARRRLPLDVLIAAAGELIGTARRHTEDFGRWLGHRVLIIDGSGVSMPDTPALQRAFGQPAAMKAGCGFPLMHLLVLFDAATGLLVDLLPGRCHRHDLHDAAALHPSLEAGDVLLGDRAFCSYAHLALLVQQQIHGLFRLHQRVIVDFAPRPRAFRPRKHRPRKRRRRGRPASRLIQRLGKNDQLVEYRKPDKRPVWMNEQTFACLPTTLTLRELRYRVGQPGFRTRTVTLLTTLTDPRKYPRRELAQLYHRRGQVETNLLHLKHTMGLDVLRCQSADGVLKELWAFVLVYNLVRMLMLEAARRQDVPVDRISFIDALDALRDRAPHEPVPALAVNPSRPGRFEPRVLKRRKDRYSYLTKPRDRLRQALLHRAVAA